MSKQTFVVKLAITVENSKLTNQAHGKTFLSNEKGNWKIETLDNKDILPGFELKISGRGNSIYFEKKDLPEFSDESFDLPPGFDVPPSKDTDKLEKALESAGFTDDAMQQWVIDCMKRNITIQQLNGLLDKAGLSKLNVAKFKAIQSNI